MTGEQRYRQIQLKARLIGMRNLRQFMAGEIDVLPCWGDIERDLIIKELDNVDHKASTA